MTTATLATGNRTMATVEKPRRSLEELVDRLMAALFKEEPQTAPATETGRWRSSLARTRRRLSRIRLGGTTPSGRTWCGDGSGTRRLWSTARSLAGPPRWCPPTTAGRLRSRRSWGCAGGPASWSRGAAFGVCGPWRRLALGPDRRVARRCRSASNG